MIFPGILLLSKESNSDKIAFFNYISLVLCLTGYLFAKSFYKNPFRTTRKLIDHKINSAKFESNNLLALIIATSVIAVVFFIYTGNFNRSSALIFLFDLIYESDINSEMSVADYRSSVYYSGTMGSINIIIGNYISTLILPLCGSFLFVEGKKRENKYIKRLGISIIIITLVFTIGTGSRLMTMRTLLFFFVIFSFVFHLNLKLILRVGFYSFLVLILLTSILGRGEQLETFGGRIVANTVKSFERIAFSKGSSSLLVYEYYPALEEYENGATFANDILGTFSKKESLAKKMFTYATGRLGTAGPQTFGELYANFGFLGQVLLSFPIGILLYAVLFIALRKKIWKSLDICAFSYMFLCFGYMGYSTAFSFKSMGLHVILLIYIILRNSSKILDKIKLTLK